MNKFLSIIFFLICFTSCCATTTIEEVKPKFNPNFSVVKVIISDSKDKVISSGSGFAIDENRIMTAYHVCSHKPHGGNISLVTINESNAFGLLRDVKVDRVDATKDLCVLKKENHGISPVKLISASNFMNLKAGDKIYIVGAPSAIFPVRVDGTIIVPLSPFPLSTTNPDFTFLSVNCYFGFSGSPVFLEGTDEVIGMLDAINKDYTQISSAIPMFMFWNIIK